MIHECASHEFKYASEALVKYDFVVDLEELLTERSSPNNQKRSGGNLGGIGRDLERLGNRGRDWERSRETMSDLEMFGGDLERSRNIVRDRERSGGIERDGERLGEIEHDWERLGDKERYRDRYGDRYGDQRTSNLSFGNQRSDIDTLKGIFKIYDPPQLISNLWF